MIKAEKVCVITSVHPHNDVRIFHKEAKSLIENGYDVFVLCPDFEGTMENIVCIKMPIEHKKIKRILYSWKTAFNYAKNIDADIYHIHDPELIKTGIKLKQIGKKVIYDAHEDIGKQILSKSWINLSLRKIIAPIVEKYVIKNANSFDLTICATEIIAEKFKNSITIHNYPDEEEIRNFYEDKKYNLRDNNICYVGSISNQRGTYEMVEAMSGIDGKLLLAGDFENLELEQEVKSHKNYGKVEILGTLSRRQVWEVLNESRIGLLVLKNTSAYVESMPIKLFEYMMAGLPVIASDFKLWRELVGTAGALFVDNQNIKEIKNAIKYLLENPDIAYEMGQAGKKIALKKYNFKVEREKLLSAYEKICIR
ncbi:MAG: glycosyltransferase family 4 protein [Oscillospiraceae bacterium]